MDDNVKQIKNDIWRLRQSIDAEELTKAEWLKEVKVVEGILEADPHNKETIALVPELQAGADGVDAALKPLYQKLAALEAQLPQAPEIAVPKFDPEKHPLLKKTLEKAEPAKPVVLNTGDICEAQWHDKGWYKAKIQGILGSASAPKYVVKFIEYDDRMTVDRDAVRPVQSKRKRDEPAASIPTPQTAPVTSTAAVISGPVSVNPNAQAANANAELDMDATQPRKKKIKNKKALAKSVDNWKNFQEKGKGKQIAGKESMFRTGNSVGSRVGFTGSGSGMTESHKRVRHDYKAEAEAERVENGDARARDDRGYSGQRGGYASRGTSRSRF